MENLNPDRTPNLGVRWVRSERGNDDTVELTPDEIVQTALRVPKPNIEEVTSQSESGNIILDSVRDINNFYNTHGLLPLSPSFNIRLMKKYHRQDSMQISEATTTSTTGVTFVSFGEIWVGLPEKANSVNIARSIEAAAHEIFHGRAGRQVAMLLDNSEFLASTGLETLDKNGGKHFGALENGLALLMAMKYIEQSVYAQKIHSQLDGLKAFGLRNILSQLNSEFSIEYGTESKLTRDEASHFIFPNAQDLRPELIRQAMETYLFAKELCRVIGCHLLGKEGTSEDWINAGLQVVLQARNTEQSNEKFAHIVNDIFGESAFAIFGALTEKFIVDTRNQEKPLVRIQSLIRTAKEKLSI